ncbi:protein-lysine methyltransferase METTL21E-like isoform 1-T1 [Acridotheres tristis]
MDLTSSQHNHLQNQWVREFERQEGEKEDEEIVAEIMGRRFFPHVIAYKAWEGFHFAGHEIRITEATDCYGAVVWPSYVHGFPPLQALVLCYFLETNSKQCNLVDKNVIEIGAGTGLVSIVASLLGAFVTATDLPELLGNLQHNVLQNTKQKCRHQPCVKELSWGIDLEKNFPRSSCHFDYIMATDVVYHHPFLDELLLTFDHLCKDDTVILWAMKFRLENENLFVDRFQTLFDLEMISNFPSLNIALYKAMRKGKMKVRPSKLKV